MYTLWRIGYHADVTGTNMPPMPTAISMSSPPPSGTPYRSAAPGLANIASPVIAANIPVVISSACAAARVREV